MSHPTSNQPRDYDLWRRTGEKSSSDTTTTTEASVLPFGRRAYIKPGRPSPRSHQPPLRVRLTQTDPITPSGNANHRQDPVVKENQHHLSLISISKKVETQTSAPRLKSKHPSHSKLNQEESVKRIVHQLPLKPRWNVEHGLDVAIASDVPGIKSTPLKTPHGQKSHLTAGIATPSLNPPHSCTTEIRKSKASSTFGKPVSSKADPRLPAPRQAWSSSKNADSVEEGKRKVTALLNKLSSVNLSSISKQILERLQSADPEDQEKLSRAIFALIFNKSLDEHTFCELYAQVMKYILEDGSIEVQENQSLDLKKPLIIKPNQLRKILLDQCELAFLTAWPSRTSHQTNSKYDSISSKVIPNQLGITFEPEMFSDEYYQTEKSKRQRIGLVGLIGELYKLEIIPSVIINFCILKILIKSNQTNEGDISCACKLLNKIILIPRAHQSLGLKLSTHLNTLQTIADSQPPTSRSRFMILVS